MSERRKYVETTANQCVVSVDMEQSHAATHLKEQAVHNLWALAREAVRTISVTEDDTALQVNMGRPIGQFDLVKADPLEPRIYGKRTNREVYVPFVERLERPVTNFVVLVLRRLARSRLRAESPEPKLLEPELLNLLQYDLFSTYIGIKTPGLPGGNPKYITQESLPFWSSHALIWGSQEVTEVYDGVPPEYRTSHE